MKTLLVATLLFSLCFSFKLETKFQSLVSNKRAALGASASCSPTATTMCVSAGGGKCTQTCDDCKATYTTCSNAAVTDQENCDCYSDYVDCTAAKKSADDTCQSPEIYDQCIQTLSNCTCGTPYTGPLVKYNCASNGYCDSNFNCVAVKGVGQTCASDSECGDSSAGLFSSFYACVNGKCAKAGAMPGDSCAANTDCTFYSNYSLGCTNGVCASQKVGSVCPTFGSSQTCGAGKYCDANNMCQNIVPVGGACNSTTKCAGLFPTCDNNVCVAEFSKSKGQACSGLFECSQGLYCNGNEVCAELLPKVACNLTGDALYCPNKNSEYFGCACWEGSPVCFYLGFADQAVQDLLLPCQSAVNAAFSCMNTNGCSDVNGDSGCAATHCKEELNCYASCFSEKLNECYSFTPQCGNPSSAALGSVGWAAVLAGASAAMML